MNLFKKYGDLAMQVNKKGSATPLPKNALQIILALSDGTTKGKAILTFNYLDRFGKRVGCDLDIIDNDISIPSGGINTEDYQALGSLTDYDDSLDMFDEVVDDCIYEIGENAPFYATLIDECTWILTDNNHPASTLAVGFDPKTGKINFYYNPEFILKGAMGQYMYASKDFRDFKDCYMYMLKYYLVHEMSHITRQHTVDNNSFLDNITPQDVNIYGDSFINQVISTRILKEKKEFYPVIGITNVLDKSGALNKGNTMASTFIMESLNTFLNAGLGLEFENTTSTKDNLMNTKLLKSMPMDDTPEIDCIAVVNFGNYLEYSKADNSLSFINAVDDFFKKLITAKKMQDDDMQQEQDNRDEEQGNSQDEKTQSENNTNPDAGEALGNNSPKNNDSNQNNTGSGDQKADGNSDNQQDGDSKGNSNSGDEDGEGNSTENKPGDPNQDSTDSKDGENPGGEGKPTQEKPNSTDSNSQGNSQGGKSAKDKMKEEQAVKDMVKKAMQKQDPGELQSLLGGDVNDILGKTPSIGAWRKALRKAVSKASGITEKWDANAVNARVEGELGREVEVPAMKSILITVDCSGSMGSVAFKKALEEIANLRKVIKGKLVVHVIYWGSRDPIYKKYKLDDKLVPNMVRDGKDLGGTYFITCVEEMISKVRKPDLVIHCTDGEFMDDSSDIDIARDKLRKFNKSTVWVLTAQHDSSIIKRIDPTSAKKTVVMNS